MIHKKKYIHIFAGVVKGNREVLTLG